VHVGGTFNGITALLLVMIHRAPMCVTGFFIYFYCSATSACCRIWKGMMTIQVRQEEEDLLPLKQLGHTATKSLHTNPVGPKADGSIVLLKFAQGSLPGHLPKRQLILTLCGRIFASTTRLCLQSAPVDSTLESTLA
jgi:hypothetical protein